MSSYTFSCSTTFSSAFWGDSQEKFHARQVYRWRQLERMRKTLLTWWQGEMYATQSDNSKQFISCRFGFPCRISTFSCLWCQPLDCVEVVLKVFQQKEKFGTSWSILLLIYFISAWIERKTWDEGSECVEWPAHLKAPMKSWFKTWSQKLRNFLFTKRDNIFLWSLSN